ncbi:hypothetical protein MASR2M15_07690 [Anaerolineales bacterium]
MGYGLWLLHVVIGLLFIWFLQMCAKRAWVLLKTGWMIIQPHIGHNEWRTNAQVREVVGTGGWLIFSAFIWASFAFFSFMVAFYFILMVISFLPLMLGLA